MLQGSHYCPQKSTKELKAGSGTIDERMRSSHEPTMVLHKIHKGQDGFDEFLRIGVLNRLIPLGHGADEWKKLVGETWFKDLLSSSRAVRAIPLACPFALASLCSLAPSPPVILAKIVTEC